MHDQNNPIEYFFSNLKIDIKIKSDPEIILDIIEKDMMLSGCEIFMDRFKAEFQVPVDLSEMVQDIQKGIYSLHPAIIEFIQHINDKGILSNIKCPDSVIIRMINYIYVLNRLIDEMHHNPHWANSIFDFVFSLRKGYGIRENSMLCLFDTYQISKDWFLAIKLASVNFVIKRYIARLKRNVNRPVKNSGYFAQVAWRTILNINILEAALGDALSKRWKNAKAGLILVMFNNQKMNNDEIMRFGHSREWASLYQSWNLAFITFGLPHLDTMYPKLLAPIIANTTSDTYMHNRVLALMLTFNWLIINIKKNRTDPMVLSKDAEIADFWGEINVNYAHKMYQKETGEAFTGIRGILKVYLSRLGCLLKAIVFR